MDMNYYKQYEPIFGEWRITKQLGEGSFGKVFAMEREDFGVRYEAALKAITIPASRAELEEVMADGMDENAVRIYYQGFVQELVREFELMSRLKGNSNIVSYENHKVIPHEGRIGWDILIQMELLTPLNKYAKQHQITRQDVIRLGIDMCKALELCQKYNIIHRDVKPENIFISPNGDFKLGDFGIARTIEKTTSGLSKKGPTLTWRRKSTRDRNTEALWISIPWASFCTDFSTRTGRLSCLPIPHPSPTATARTRWQSVFPAFHYRRPHMRRDGWRRSC